MRITLALVDLALYVVLTLLLMRLVLDWVRMFARAWRPRGAALVFAEGVYTCTDPPVRLVRRAVPPLRIGGASLDVAFLLLLLGVSFARTLLSVAAERL